jgi:hypothetical protein
MIMIEIFQQVLHFFDAGLLWADIQMDFRIKFRRVGAPSIAHRVDHDRVCSKVGIIDFE